MGDSPGGQNVLVFSIAFVTGNFPVALSPRCLYLNKGCSVCMFHHGGLIMELSVDRCVRCEPY